MQELLFIYEATHYIVLKFELDNFDHNDCVGIHREVKTLMTTFFVNASSQLPPMKTFYD